MAISSLVVKVKTADLYGAGTDNNVYFDIGPLGWELATSGRNNFERDRVDLYELDLSGITLLETDIVWLRLQKKGIGGLNGMPDGLDGRWRPEWIELWVNGRLFAQESVGVWLHVLNDVWVKRIQYAAASEAEVFARTLRMKPNEKLSPLDETAAFVATEFKASGISGWRSTPIERASAIGYAIRPVPLSTDGLATIDLELEAVSANGEFFRTDGSGHIHGRRYIRVEYLARMNPWPAASGVYRLPAQGERVRISGTVKWDTDYEWWYEIHPTGPEDVEFLQPRPTLSLRVAYPTPTAIRKDKGVYHWPGLSSVPADFGDTCKAQDFTYQALYYSDHPRVELLISTPGRPVRWFIENEQIQQGSGSVSVIPTGNHASTLPPLDGTAFPGAPVTVTYQLSGDALDLGNVPDDGNYDVHVRAETDDEVGVVTAGAWVSFKGDEFQMDPAYRKTSELCRAAAVLARGNYRTSPLPVPKYDPQSWAQVPEEQLRSIWQALQRAVSEHRRVELTAEDMDPVTLTRQVHATLVAYPEAAARISNLLPERIARHLREIIPGAS